MLVKKSDLDFVGALICPLNCVTENRKSAPSYHQDTRPLGWPNVPKVELEFSTPLQIEVLNEISAWLKL